VAPECIPTPILFFFRLPFFRRGPHRGFVLVRLTRPPLGRSSPSQERDFLQVTERSVHPPPFSAGLFAELLGSGTGDSALYRRGRLFFPAVAHNLGPHGPQRKIVNCSVNAPFLPFFPFFLTVFVGLALVLLGLPPPFFKERSPSHPFSELRTFTGVLSA